MALVKATMQATIKAKLDAEYGAPVGGVALAEQTKFTSAIADALIDILTTQMAIAVSVTTTGVTAVGPPGGPLPITAQPGTGTGTVS